MQFGPAWLVAIWLIISAYVAWSAQFDQRRQCENKLAGAEKAASDACEELVRVKNSLKQSELALTEARDESAKAKDSLKSQRDSIVRTQDYLSEVKAGIENYLDKVKTRVDNLYSDMAQPLGQIGSALRATSLANENIASTAESNRPEPRQAP